MVLNVVKQKVSENNKHKWFKIEAQNYRIDTPITKDCSSEKNHTNQLNYPTDSTRSGIIEREMPLPRPPRPLPAFPEGLGGGFPER